MIRFKKSLASRALRGPFQKSRALRKFFVVRFKKVERFANSSWSVSKKSSCSKTLRGPFQKKSFVSRALRGPFQKSRPLRGLFVVRFKKVARLAGSSWSVSKTSPASRALRGPFQKSRPFRGLFMVRFKKVARFAGSSLSVSKKVVRFASSS